MDFETVLNSIENLPASKKIDLQEAYYRVEKERDTALEQAKEASTRADTLTIDKALGESAFIRDSVSADPFKQGYAREHYRDRFRVESGRVVAYANGQKLYNGQGQPCSVDEALARFIHADPLRDSLMDKSGSAGSAAGRQGIPAGVKVLTRAQFHELDPRARMAAIKSGTRIVD